MVLHEAGASLQPGSAVDPLTAYTAPEQVHGKTADARSDIFAFGAILYELLSAAGRSPAREKNCGLRLWNANQLPAAQLKLIVASLPGPAPEPYMELLPLSNGHALPEPVERPLEKRGKCPKCKATDVRPSRPKDAWEDRLAEFGVKFNRCYHCYHRFLRIAFLAVSLDD